MGTTNGCLRKGGVAVPGDCLRPLAPLVSCRICAACVQREQPVKHIKFKTRTKTTVIAFIVSNAKLDVVAL